MRQKICKKYILSKNSKCVVLSKNSKVTMLMMKNQGMYVQMIVNVMDKEHVHLLIVVSDHFQQQFNIYNQEPKKEIEHVMEELKMRLMLLMNSLIINVLTIVNVMEKEYAQY